MTECRYVIEAEAAHFVVVGACHVAEDVCAARWLWFAVCVDVVGVGCVLCGVGVVAAVDVSVAFVDEAVGGGDSGGEVLVFCADCLDGEL